MDTYCITRFFQEQYKPSETIYTGLTKEQAETHCNFDYTKGEGWFEGFSLEE